MCSFPASGSSWKSFARGGVADTIAVTEDARKRAQAIAPVVWLLGKTGQEADRDCRATWVVLFE
jgi:hypothetical protein